MRILFVGDIALGDHPKAVGFGFYSKYMDGIPALKSRSLFPHNIKADLIFGNLEFSLADEEIKGRLLPELYCRGIKSYGPFLKEAGFSVLNLANNHQYQHGEMHFKNTIKILNSNGIQVCGLPDDFSTESIINVGRKSLSFLGWSDRPRQDFTEPPRYNEFDEKNSYKEIERLSKLVDHVCVSIHWGEEFVEIPNDRERAIAHNMIDHGAAVVIGHHPHVIREIEAYNGGIIAYSLGNFIGDMIWNKKTRESGCLCVELDKEGVTGHIFYPAIIGNDYFPHYLSNEHSSRFMRDKNAEYHILYSVVTRRSYEYLSKREMRRHQWLTIAFLLKNLYKYKPSHVFEMLYHAIISRIKILKDMV
jgi:poly-gamma-glutamate synthesis protein (capsule biosynthesis protein)